MHKYRKPRFGFTLAELLVALGVLGVISTFTIPKILTAQNYKKYNAMSKGAAAAVSNAYQQYQLSNTPTASTKSTDLIPYFNAAKVKTTGLVDDDVGYGSIDCAAYTCILLHNGGVIWADASSTFAGTTSLNALYINYDADGVYGGSTTGDSKALGILLYYNGRLMTTGKVLSGTILYGGLYPGENDPPWFSWN